MKIISDCGMHSAGSAVTSAIDLRSSVARYGPQCCATAFGPKRASNIRKLFALSKDDDIRDYVNKCLRRKFTLKSGCKQDKAPKIQRLITPVTLQHKRRRAALKRRSQEKSRRDAAD